MFWKRAAGSSYSGSCSEYNNYNNWKKSVLKAKSRVGELLRLLIGLRIIIFLINNKETENYENSRRGHFRDISIKYTLHQNRTKSNHKME